MPDWNHIVREHLAVLRLPPEREIEIVEELALHLEAAYEDALADGLSETEAEARAVRNYDWRLLECELSCAEQPLAERALQPSLELIERKGGMRMESFLQDLRFGARMLVKNPGFTLIAALTLSLGIGVTTAIFSVFNAVLLRPLPYAAPEQLVRLFDSSKTQPRFPMARGNFQEYRARNSTLAGLALFTRQDVELSLDEKPERLAALEVTAGFFDVLGVRPSLGREFRREEESPSESAPVILSHGLWQRQFRGDPKIIGRGIKLSGRGFTVVGVMPPGLHHVGGDYRSLPHGESVQLWLPLQMPARAERSSHFCNAIGRLKPGISQAQAEADFSVIAGQLAQQFPETNEGWRIALRPLREELVGHTRTTLAILLGAVFFVLLIGCVNVANLLLARATAREREIAVRASLGAGRGRIIRQLLTESLFLASLGGGAGILLAQGMIQALRMLGPEQLPRLQSVSLDGRILLFTLGLTLLAGLIFGLAPAWRGGQVNLNESLKEAGRSATGVRQRRVRDALVMAEVALALSLLIGAGLLLRSFWKIQQTDSGFNPERVLTASLSLPAARYGDDAKVTAFYQQLLNRIAALGGVQSAGLTSDLPWTGYDENAGGFSIEGKTFPPDQDTEARYHYVSDEYFRAIGVPLIAGRFFNASDRPDTPKVVLINQSMANRYWAGAAAVGKRFTWADRPQEKDWYNVVGVVGDIKDFPHSAAAAPAFFWPISQQPPVGARYGILAISAKSDPLQLIEALRKEVRALDKDLPLAEVKTLEAVASAAVAGRRFALWLVGLLALIALSLAAVGTYSVLSYLVAQRTREIGIRMALGAQTRDVQRLVIGQGMKLALGGVSLGLLASLALTRSMQNLLYGVSASDPITFGAIALLSLAVALVACWLPASRATRVDPLTSLRHE